MTTTGATMPPSRFVAGYSVFKYSMIAARSLSVSTSVNSCPVFDWLYIRVL